MRWLDVQGDGTGLAALDFGETGSGVLLLHGLAGTAFEWASTADWLTAGHHVVALDQRGHGRSERRPDDVSRRAFVADAVAAIEALELAPTVLVGQSLGGQTAFLVAAERPDLVRGLVVAEASPADLEPSAPERLGGLLAAWPVPFPDRNAALDFFGRGSPRAHAWADNLVPTDDGLVAAFDVDVMVAALEASAEACWDEWASVRSPTLVVRAEDGDLSAEDAGRMIETLPRATLVTIPGGHDIHLDAPEAWRAVLERFLAELG
jgi:pimeloyl-ACP methyl ester carboxylesterase